MPTLTIERAIRSARIMVGCFLIYLVLLPLVLETFMPSNAAAVDRTFFAAICVVSVAEIGIALVSDSELRSRDFRGAVWRGTPLSWGLACENGAVLRGCIAPAFGLVAATSLI